MGDRLEVCLNGRRRRDEHPAVPLTPAQLATAAKDSVAAGAQAVHVHPRGDDGYESLRASDVGAAVAAVRHVCPGVPVGVSTGLWISGHDPAAQLAAVATWAELEPDRRPDRASVNVGEPGFAEVIDALQSAGIGVEIGVWSIADADRLAASGRADWRHLLVEVIGTPLGEAATAAARILSRLDELGIRGSRLLHGQDENAWSLVAMAGQLGLATRIGLEDVLSGPDRRPVRDNAELVQLAMAVWRGERSPSAEATTHTWQREAWTRQPLR
jgi:uncharacterized protein (DUF849 family)